jgi:hypothetical protein
MYIKQIADVLRKKFKDYRYIENELFDPKK